MRITSPALSLFAACLSLGGSAVTTQAAEPGPKLPAEERTVTFQIRDLPLREAIQQVLPADLKYRVEKDVPNVPLTLNVRNVSVAAALRMLVRQASATHPGVQLAREGEVLRVFVGVPPKDEERPAPPALEAKHPNVVAFLNKAAGPPVTANFKDANFNAVIRQIMTGTGLQYSLSPSIETPLITLNLREVSVAAAVDFLVRMANEGVNPGDPPRVELALEKDVLILRKPLKK